MEEWPDEATLARIREWRQYLVEIGGLDLAEWDRLFDAKNFTRLEELLAEHTPSIEMITDETFDEKVLSVFGPILVFFGTGSVPGGHELGAVLERLVRTTKRKVYRMTIEGSTAVRARFVVAGLPALHLFRKGRLLAIHRGADYRPEKIEEWIRYHTTTPDYKESKIAGPSVSTLPSAAPSTP